MENVYGRFYAGKAKPDCGTCVEKESCKLAKAGRFCPRWRSEEPKDRGEGPAEKWSRGEENDV